MMTEDDLREQLHQEAASVRPPGDLIPTLAAGHTRRYQRTQRMKMGGAAAAIVAVVTVLTSVFAAGGPTSSQPGSSSEIIKRAKEADASARNMILHSTIDRGGPMNNFEEWQQRAAKQRRSSGPGGFDAVERPDGSREWMDYSTKTWGITPKWNPPLDPPFDSTVTSQFQAKDWYDEPDLIVDPPSNGQVRLGVHSHGTSRYLWLDARTYLPVRFEGLAHDRITFEWLPPTADNLKLLTHTIPPDFTREEK
jgi:hypothetical protein